MFMLIIMREWTVGMAQPGEKTADKNPFWGLIQTDAESVERQIQEAARQWVGYINYAVK